MTMKEKDFQVDLNKWMSRNGALFGTLTGELKICKNKKSLPFNAVQPHQLRALKLSQKWIIFKIPDEGLSQKPFDFFQICNAKAMIFIMFYQRGKTKFVGIDVDIFEKEALVSKRKSLTEARAAEIGTVYNLED